MGDLEISALILSTGLLARDFDPAVAAVVPEWWGRLIDLFSSPAGVAVLAVGVFGLFIGWLLGRSREKPVSKISENEPVSSDLTWRHEKLVLVERQQVEKHQRLMRFLDAVGGAHENGERQLGIAVFSLAEQVREARQKIGTDLSRMQLVGERLSDLENSGTSRPEAVSAAREMAASQEKGLEKSRDIMRNVQGKISGWEDPLLDGEVSDTNYRVELKEDVEAIRTMLQSLDPGWDRSPDEADRQIRDLLRAGDELEYRSICSVVLVDGGETASLGEANRHSDLMAATDRILEVLEAPEEIISSENEPSLIPDAGFRHPPAALETPPLNGTGKRKPADPDASENSIPKPEDGKLILFCSNRVDLWGKDVYRAERCRARSIEELPDWAEWISIRRLDTGERVFSSADTASFQNGEVDSPFGFNGSNELFYGARHLGIYSDSCPNDVETRFTYGGWGFGHRMSDSPEDPASPQASGWEGVEIPGDTVFEIAIHSELPELGETDKVLSLESQTV